MPTVLICDLGRVTRTLELAFQYHLSKIVARSVIARYFQNRSVCPSVRLSVTFVIYAQTVKHV